ncbi:MAG: hypothetical protein HC903_30435 [Methylacidiphilales bacterium]|nr:hypothetical protein [Candidatus Methylacidiphilales bacterium]
MAEVLSTPQFQVLTHQYTGEKTGRIYFSALFLAEFNATSFNGGNLRNGVPHECVTQWLQQQDILFDKKDLKQYEDGSFRLYFRVNNPLEVEYFRLVNILMNRSSSGNKEKF